MEGICPMCRHPKVVPLGPNGLCVGYHEKQYAKLHKQLKPVNPKSEQQTQRDKIYGKLATAYKATHPTCEAKLKGCTVQTTDVHHKAGKIGDKLTDTTLFLAVCRHCHNEIESKPSFAKALGLSVSRLAKETTEKES